jgi:tetratricopeptide (TPR) repeat protein
MRRSRAGADIRASASGLARGVAAAVLVLGASTTLRAQEPDAKDWVGKRVIQKGVSFGLQGDENTVKLSRGRIEIYRVERVEGGRLRLLAPGVSGLADPSEVVPVDEAIEYFTDYIRDHPDEPHGFTMRAIVNHRVKKDLDAALADYNDAVRVAPGAPHVYNNRGNIRMAKRDYDGAIEDYGEAIRLSPGYGLAFSNRGNAKAAKKQFARAIEDYDRALAVEAPYAGVLVNRGASRFALKEYDRALADYDEAIRLDPKYVAAYTGRGEVRLEKKDYERALADYDEAIKLDPKSAVRYNARGHARSVMKEYARAVADYDEAIKLDPKYALALSNRGLARRAQGDLDRALADFDAAIRLEPKLSFLYNNRGITRQDKGDYAQALADIDAAIKADPKYGLPYRNRAVLALITGRDSAEADARAAIEHEGWWGESAIFSVLLGHFGARRVGDDGAARRLLDDAFQRCDLSTWPYPVVRYLRKEIDAPALLDLAVDDDKKTEAHCYLGLDLLLAGHPDAARDHFRWVREHGNTTYMEYSIARAELTRLAPKPKPRPARGP